MVVDISDPDSPGLLHTYDTPGSAQGLCIAGDYCYVADGDSGLHALQVFSGRLDISSNIGQSVVVDEAPAP